ncbi:putative molybdopterin cofactor synthesis protein A [Dissulfuribacter thermophilus]|uniref:Putative molybdopterin cofactor synthesis protein A n=1 Tax=Dissulfuribacter thermophilus TaxID=1156395 RepID=A0A1B9F3L3_9BACT|nr:radical SAM/SPASM domain-containing protein [Dissulfuribacter thermophilus]OCC14351.1 putative molybdopterin cofactor synthesis protein A [Dissulfuribacter thermophilus]
MKEFIPHSIDLEITNYCENNCLMCPRDAILRPKGMMDRVVFDQIKDFIRTWDALVTISGMGDPLLHPSLFEYIEKLNDEGIKNGIVINPLSLIKRKGALEDLARVKPGVITVSFPSIVKTVFESLIPGASFEDSVELVKILHELSKAKRFGLRVSGLLTSMNSSERGEFISFWKKRGINVWVRRCHSRGGNLKNGLPLRVASEPNGMCWLFKVHAFFSWNGDMLSCCHDLKGETSMINVLESRQDEIFKVRRMAFSRRPHFELCSRCDEELKSPSGSLLRSFQRLSLEK